MIKKTLAAFMAMIVLGGLAYYSGVLYTEKTAEGERAYLKAPQAIFWGAPFPSLETVNKGKTERSDAQNAARQEVSTQGDLVLAETEEYLYYLVEESGRVNIYQADRQTIYEYTDITMDMLPPELQQEIMNGKGMSSEGELYDFLENYSS